MKAPIQLIIVIFAVSAIYIWKFIYRLFLFESDKKKNPLKHYNLEVTKAILMLDLNAVACIYLDKPCSAEEHIRHKRFLDGIETDTVFQKHPSQKDFYDFLISLGFKLPPFCAPKLISRKEKLSILKDIEELYRELGLIRKIAVKVRDKELFEDYIKSASNEYLMARTKQRKQPAELNTR